MRVGNIYCWAKTPDSLSAEKVVDSAGGMWRDWSDEVRATPTATEASAAAAAAAKL
jgi:hypothetical protein